MNASTLTRDPTPKSIQNNAACKLKGYANSALAFKRAGDRHNAEVNYFIALSLLKCNWCHNNFILMGNILTFYSAGNNADSTIGLVLVCLLHKAGCKPALGSTNYHQELVNGPSWMELIKPQYLQSPASAKEAFLQALQPPTIEHFRRTILGYWDSSKGLSFAMHRQDESTIRKRDKGIARDVVRGGALVASFSYCSNPSCHRLDEDKKLMCCPCKGVSYCGKTCQRTHWKDHKRFCAWHQSKNKTS
jgi:hypothetical protein